jgi:hypothetical protein
MNIDVGVYNGNVDIRDFLKAIDLKVATEDTAGSRRLRHARFFSQRGYRRVSSSTSILCLRRSGTITKPRRKRCRSSTPIKMTIWTLSVW